MKAEIATCKRKISKLERNIDRKFKDTTVDDAVVSATGTVQPQIFVIGNGDTANQKDGIKITIVECHLQMIITLADSTVNNEANDTLRVILLKDKQANKALPAVADILTGTAILDFYELSNERRFIPLWDKMITVNASTSHGDGTTNSSTETAMNMQFKKKLNFPIYYNNSGSTGLIATIDSNNLVLLYISNKGLIGVKASFRVVFTDS